jgi:hypothetical protein
MLRNREAVESVKQFKHRLIADIEQEYQHNFTQQLYVSDAAWAAIRDLKESTVSLFRNAGQGLSEEASSDDYIAKVLCHLSELEVDPYDAVQVILKKELSA